MQAYPKLAHHTVHYIRHCSCITALDDRDVVTLLWPLTKKKLVPILYSCWGCYVYSSSSCCSSFYYFGHARGAVFRIIGFSHLHQIAFHCNSMFYAILYIITQWMQISRFHNVIPLSLGFTHLVEVNYTNTFLKMLL